MRTGISCYDSHDDGISSGRGHSFASRSRSAGGKSWMVPAATGITQYGFDVDNVAGDQQHPAAISYLLVDPCEGREGLQGG